MKGTQSKDADVLHRAMQEYFNNLAIGTLTESQATVLDKLMSDGGIVCDDALDSQVLQLQLQYTSTNDDNIKDGILQSAIELLYN